MSGIDVSALTGDFAKYIESNQKSILTKLTQKTVSQEYMTSVVSKDTEWRAAKAVIDDLVQGFQKGWTPKGTATFTPIVIPQRRHKIDFEFYPDDVVDKWIGFLADETKDRKEWPITRYVIEQLIVPKVLDNRELKLVGKGTYVAPTTDQAQNTGLSMDGFCTILKNKLDAGNSNVNFFGVNSPGWIGVPTATNIVDFMEAFVDWIDVLYQGMDMPIFVSNTWYKAYKRKYRDLYGTHQGFSKEDADRVDYSMNRLVPLPSMAGEDVMFVTPKENFIRLRNQNDGADKLTVDRDKRMILIFADWYESVGFAMEEAIFAYVPDQSSASA